MDKDKRLEAIFRAALAEFSEFGYQRANISSIADRLDMTKGNLYFFISSKKELYESSIAWGLEQWQMNVFLSVTAIDDPLEQFKLLCDHSYKYLAEDTILRTILIRDTSLFPIDPLVKGRFMEIHKRSIRMIADILQKGITRGVFRSEMDVDHMSQLVYSIYVMFIVKTYILSKEHSFDRYFSEAVELILQGVIKK